MKSNQKISTNKASTGIAVPALRKVAFVAGFGSVITAIVAGFSFGFVHQKLIAPGDAIVTVNNIMESEILFRAGIFGWLIILILDILVTWGLYVFLKPVNKSVSLLAAWLGLAAAIISGIAQLDIVIVLPLLSGADYLKVFGQAQLHALALLFLNAYDKIWSVGLFVFGSHLLIRGYLVFKSGYIPKIFGVLLIIASLCYLISSAANLLLPNYESFKATVDMFISVPMTIGELAFAFWLLFKGGKNQPEK
jgi:hypothetical protein